MILGCCSYNCFYCRLFVSDLEIVRLQSKSVQQTDPKESAPPLEATAKFCVTSEPIHPPVAQLLRLMQRKKGNIQKH